MKIATFSERLSELMASRGLRAVDVVELCYYHGVHISKSFLSQVLSGKKAGRVDTVESVAMVLGVDSAWLMGYEVLPFNVSSDEYELILQYRSSSPERKDIVKGILARGGEAL